MRRCDPAIGDPAARFREIICACCALCGSCRCRDFTLDPATQAAAVAAHAAWLARVSAERIAALNTRLLCESPRPSGWPQLLRETGLLREFLARGPGVARHPTAAPLSPRG